MTTYVLDTSVLLNAGKSIFTAFGAEDSLIVPIGVIRSLESYQNHSELGWIARNVLRALEDIRSRETYAGGASDGWTQLENGHGRLRIELNHKTAPEGFAVSAAERSNTVLVAYNLNREAPITLLSNDLTQRLIAGSQGIDARPFSRASLQGNYTGMSEHEVAGSVIDRLYENGEVSAEGLGVGDPISPYHVYVLKAGSQSVLATRMRDKLVRYDLETAVPSSLPIKGRSVQQKIAMSRLLDPGAKIISLGGPAGTGKTLLSLAVGHWLMESQGSKIKRLVVFRPLSKVGQEDLGFLPGTEEEKMQPWTEAIRDALLVWLSPNAVDRMFREKKIEVQSTSFIRGRTIDNAFILVDEAQNYERLSLLSLLSRMGPNAKCALSWDASQRDNLYIGKDDGIVSIVDRMKSEPLFAHVTLTKSERSAAADLASRVLEELDL